MYPSQLTNNKFGSPFYYLNPSLVPKELINQLTTAPQTLTRYDEYGFAHGLGHGHGHGEHCSSTDTSSNGSVEKSPPMSDVHSTLTEVLPKREQYYNQLKQKWIKFLENEYNKLASSSCFDLSKFDSDIDNHSTVLAELIDLGPIPNQLRPFFWLRLSKTLTVKTTSKWTFTELDDLSVNINTLTDQQIAKLLPRNVCYSSSNLVAVERLKRIVRMIKWERKVNFSSKQTTFHSNTTNTINEMKSGSTTKCSKPNSNSSNTLNIALIGAYLLLVCNQEDSFWLLYKLNTDLNVDVCIRIVTQVMDKCCPIVADLLQRHDIAFELIASGWYNTMFASYIRNAHLLYALWDMYFYEGPIFLVQFTIGLLIVEVHRLQQCTDAAKLFNALTELPWKAFDCPYNQWWIKSQQLLDKLIRIWKTGQNVVNNIPSIMPSLFFKNHITQIDNSNESATSSNALAPNNEKLKLKNIKQTSIMVNLHEAIVAIANHFQGYNLSTVYNLEPNFEQISDINKPTMEDIQNRLKAYRRKRARALIDFEATETDELGFRKNDIITVLNQKDEHCWIGELNEKFGWFPAKFVEMLEEIDQDYCIAGDDRVVPFINDLVRGRLCSALKSIFTYDLRRASYFVAVHPWTVIEEIANQVVNGGDFKSIYSKLVLTKTFYLDEFTKVLTPNESMYRSIALVNATHRSNTPLDVKLRSLICLGLNQYVLHEWFDLICTGHRPTIQRFYGASSFLTTPVWQMIKAELRLLSQFSFSLNVNAEIEVLGNGTNNTGDGQSSQPKSPITKEGVYDMLFKYHLFSWDV